MHSCRIFVFLFTLLCSGACTQSGNEESPASGGTNPSATHPEKIVSEEKPKLPNFQVTDLAGNVISTSQLPKTQPTIILFFHPDCEHCQAEATELQKHTDQFAGTNFLMITWDELPKIRAFMQKYALKEPIVACQISSNTLAQTYGMIRLPAVYIYNTNQELIQQFSGEAKAEAIVSYLPK